MESADYNTVDVILKQKNTIRQSRRALIWAVVNFILASLLFWDIYGSHGSFCSLIYCVTEMKPLEPFIWSCEFGLAVLFSWNTFFDLIIYLWPLVCQQVVFLKPMQKVLFGIKDDEPGFKITPPKKSPPVATPFTSTPKLSFVLPNQQTPNQSGSPYNRLISTSFNTSGSSWANTSYSSSPNMSLSSSWNYIPGISTSGIYYPVDSSQSYLSETPEDVRQRKNVLNLSHSPLLNRVVTDEKSLDEYLKDHEMIEQKSQLMAQDSQATNVTSFWNYPVSPFGVLATLKKFQYQPASRSPQLASSLTDDPDSPATFSGDSVWTKLKISERNLNKWIENLRKWLTLTILMPVVAEIDSINEALRRLGSPDIQIGDVSISTLRQVALTKSTYISTFSTLIPYLDMTTNQEYLVQRLRDLAKGGCMSEFRWNGGGQYKGKPWTDLLPTDASIVMHMFCTYLDSRLPPQPTYPDGKTFTSQYFQKATDKQAITKDTLCLYQCRNLPPHYRVIISDDTWDLPKGRNNMFYAVLLFLHHVKTKHCGMLGRINLGPSGVNILWVIEEN